jgi:phosphonate transport system permease protein
MSGASGFALGARRDPALARRLTLALAGLALLWPAAELAEFEPGRLLDPSNLAVMSRFVATFFPMALGADFLSLVATAALETLALATAGTALAMLLALPLAITVSRSLAASALLRPPVRALLVFLRSIPEIVWALLFVRAVGLGPAAGVLAIAISYTGMLGKVYFEIFESSDTGPARAILEAGGGRASAFLYGTLPVALPEIVSYSVYRWECAIRASVVMGFVGAGGLGQQMELSMRMLAGAEVSTMLVVLLLLVAAADGISATLRRILA